MDTSTDIFIVDNYSGNEKSNFLFLEPQIRLALLKYYAEIQAQINKDPLTPIQLKISLSATILKGEEEIQIVNSIKNIETTKEKTGQVDLFKMIGKVYKEEKKEITPKELIKDGLFFICHKCGCIDKPIVQQFTYPNQSIGLKAFCQHCNSFLKFISNDYLKDDFIFDFGKYFCENLKTVAFEYGDIFYLKWLAKVSSESLQKGTQTKINHARLFLIKKTIKSIDKSYDFDDTLVFLEECLTSSPHQPT